MASAPHSKSQFSPPQHSKAGVSDGPQGSFSPGRTGALRTSCLLFLASFVALYFEVVVIRYLSTEVRVFAYVKNLPLIASFLGLGVGLSVREVPSGLKRFFPLVTVIFFLLIAFASPLHLTHLPFPKLDYFVWHTFESGGAPASLLFLRYIAVVLAMVTLLVAFFIVLGGRVGEYIAPLPPLTGYAINLLGSLLGIAAYTLLCFYNLPPSVWLLLGFLAAVPLFIRQRLALLSFGLVLLASAPPKPEASWSPYYRISLYQWPTPPGWREPSAYLMNVNHDYHQKILDLSPEFMARFPGVEPNRSAFSTYEFPYRVVTNPKEVLIVGSGTGNDVAAALRHGALHIDAVEIDPMILEMGRRLHPERPYASAKVTVHVGDARAYFRKAKQKYDLIVFGYLDSHTLLTSLSSVRLDNFVYTTESLREARTLLNDDGTLVMSFASGKTFVTGRLYETLRDAFGQFPRAFFTDYDGAGVVFVAGKGRDFVPRTEFQEITEELQAKAGESILATDNWPFLYLEHRTIPYSILWVVGPFLIAAVALVRRTLGLPRLADPQALHLFLLGAGFLLLETKAVTQLALVFGSTWVVNSVVIGAFLTMALLANGIVMVRRIPVIPAYAVLLSSLIVGIIFPYSVLNPLPLVAKIVAAGLLVGLPVFCSGLIFSRSFRDVASPAKGLGVNLLGAVVGGALENTVMVGGTVALGILAILVYAFSALCLRNAGSVMRG